MRVTAWVLGLTACGRVGFDSVGLDTGDTEGPLAIALDVVSRFEDVAVDVDGTIVVTGHIQAPTVLGGVALSHAGDTDIVLASIASDGTIRWARSFGSPAAELARSVAVDSTGEIYFAGGFEGTLDFDGSVHVTQSRSVFVTSYTREGVFRWSRSFGDSPGDNDGIAIVVAPDGDVVVGGSVGGSADFGDGVVTPASTASIDAFMARYSSSGSLRWARRWGVVGTNKVIAAAVDTGGNIYATGYYDGTVDFGDGTHPSRGQHDAFVLALTAGGALRWSRTWGGPGEDRGLGAAVIDDVIVTGGFYEAGSSLPGVAPARALQDAQLVAHSSQGDLRWTFEFGAGGCDSAFAMRARGQEIVFGGAYAGSIDLGETMTAAGGHDALLGTISSAGVVTSASSIGGTGDDQVYAVDVRANRVISVGVIGDVKNLCASSFVGVGFVDRR